ncbi:hypothetical protein HanPSC8_Chr17g0791401 [Helianthus annuus]|nr:hypothetical protein HanPSC8_Chr17g0791401 [Helianthus annuus]
MLPNISISPHLTTIQYLLPMCRRVLGCSGENKCFIRIGSFPPVTTRRVCFC